MKKLKVLNTDLTSPFKQFKYEIGKEYICEDFDDNPKEDCSKGFYATDIEGLPYSWNINRKCFEVEVSGKQVIYNQYKQRFEKQTIIRQVFKDELIELALKEENRLGYKLSEVLFPVNPLLLSKKEVTNIEINLLREWVSVWNSVGWSFGDSVRDSVEDLVEDSVWDLVEDLVCDLVEDSVWDSVGDSVEDSVWAYASSLFHNIKTWKYIDHKPGDNPFQSCIELWRSGFIPSFDGKVWRLHQGKNVNIVYELKL